MQERILTLLEQIQSSINNLNEKIENNHKELLEKLNTIEYNQRIIM